MYIITTQVEISNMKGKRELVMEGDLLAKVLRKGLEILTKYR